MDTVIELNKLTIGCISIQEKETITSDINTSLYKGELVCFIRPNGAGKSTLMKTISGAPGDLVLDGVFQQAFSVAGIHFEKQSDSFKIHSTCNTSVSLRGEGVVATWTQRALERMLDY